MKRKIIIEKILSDSFSKWGIEVKDISILHKGHNNFDGNKETHFSIILNRHNQNNDSKLKIHRKIYKLLENEFNSGLHALQIKIIN